MIFCLRILAIGMKRNKGWQDFLPEFIWYIKMQMGNPKIIDKSCTAWCREALIGGRLALEAPFWACEITEEQGGFHMVEQEWMKFASTGSVQDYLSYKCHQEAEGFYGGATDSLMTERENMGRSVDRYGTDHSADGHGVISNPSRGV